MASPPVMRATTDEYRLISECSPAVGTHAAIAAKRASARSPGGSKMMKRPQFRCGRKWPLYLLASRTFTRGSPRWQPQQRWRGPRTRTPAQASTHGRAPHRILTGAWRRAASQRDEQEARWVPVARQLATAAPRDGSRTCIISISAASRARRAKAPAGRLPRPERAAR